MKPYIISHMMMSVDGRIDCQMVAQISGDEYYAALERLGHSSKLSGRVTAALEWPAVKAENGKAEEGTFVDRESVYMACRSDEYTIVVDTYGRLQWASGEADGHPVLCILSEQIPEKHLEELREKGISWIVTGKERIDLKRAMELLFGHFGIERLVIVGGGHINGGFLEAGLVDEVSVMVAPGIDGRKGQTAVFDGIANVDTVPFRLKLQSLEQWPDTETVWLRYKTIF